MPQAAQGFGNAVGVVLKGMGKGVFNTFEHSAALCQLLVTHTIDEVIKSLYKAGIALGKAVYSATELALTNPEIFSKKAKDRVLKLGRYVHDKPEEAIAGIVECLLSRVIKDAQ